MKLIVCTLHGRNLTPEWAGSMLNLAYNPVAETIIWLEQGLYIHRSRNEVFMRAQDKKDFDGLLFIDSDIAFTPMNVKQLIESPYDVTTGIYLNRWNGLPIVYNWSKGTNKRKMDAILLTELGETPFKVDICGAGFLFIKRPVLERFTKSVIKRLGLPFDHIKMDGTFFGEDMSFCYRLGQLDIPVYCDPNIRVCHVGHHVLHGDGRIEALVSEES